MIRWVAWAARVEVARHYILYVRHLWHFLRHVGSLGTSPWTRKGGAERWGVAAFGDLHEGSDAWRISLALRSSGTWGLVLKGLNTQIQTNFCESKETTWNSLPPLKLSVIPLSNKFWRSWGNYVFYFLTFDNCKAFLRVPAPSGKFHLIVLERSANAASRIIARRGKVLLCYCVPGQLSADARTARGGDGGFPGKSRLSRLQCTTFLSRSSKGF